MAKPTEHVIDKMVTGYHLMISSGQEIINELKNPTYVHTEESTREGIWRVQKSIDQAAYVLWKLNDRVMSIDQTMLSAFATFNQNIVAFNAAQHETLVQTRKVGDITETQHNVVFSTEDGDHATNGATHLAPGEDNHGPTGHHLAGISLENSDCCAAAQ
jgi:hypothetical protein